MSPVPTPHSELLAAKDWNVTKVVVFFRSEKDDRQRYVDFEPGALTDLFEQLEIERQERADFEASQAKLLEQLEAARIDRDEAHLALSKIGWKKRDGYWMPPDSNPASGSDS